MSKGKYTKSAQTRAWSVKLTVVVLAGILAVCGAIGGTYAWLTATSDEVENTFTTSTIGVTLTEEEKAFQMVPGWQIDKTPVATVEADSEDCYLFVEVTEAGGNVTVGEVEYSFSDFIAYAIDEEWTELEDVSDTSKVYYKVLDSDEKKNAEHHILAGGTYNEIYTWEPDQVLTKPEVTKEMMAAVDNDEAYPTLSFQAYAVQLFADANNTKFTAAEAWALR